MEISNLSDAEFKILVIRIFKELSEGLNSIEKIWSEMKDTLIEIETNLQGNSRVDEAENRKDDLEYKEAKEPWLVWLHPLYCCVPENCYFN